MSTKWNLSSKYRWQIHRLCPIHWSYLTWELSSYSDRGKWIKYLTQDITQVSSDQLSSKRSQQQVCMYLQGISKKHPTWLHSWLSTMSSGRDGCSGRGRGHRGRSIPLLLGYRWWPHLFPPERKCTCTCILGVITHRDTTRIHVLVWMELWYTIYPGKITKNT